MTQLTALIREKQLERERLANQYSSLVRVQNEQNDWQNIKLLPSRGPGSR